VPQVVALPSGDRYRLPLWASITIHQPLARWCCAPPAAARKPGDRPLTARQCSRPACKQAALYTLTYVYRDSTAVLGPLAAFVEPHCYDLCARHADRMTAPRGWEVVRLPVGQPDEAAVSDDLEALANAVREATGPRTPDEPTGQGIEVGRRGHLRVLRSAPSDGGRLR